MMRIVGGQLGGRRIAAPRGRVTRPTSDRVREAIFDILASSLGNDLGQPGVLDAFAGSGALGLEALSRGARGATFVESDRIAFDLLRANLRMLDLDARATAVRADVQRLARKGSVPGGPFALLFVDPPYRIGSPLVAGVLGDLGRFGLLEPGAVVVWEHAASLLVQWPDGFDEQTSRKYGDTAVSLASWRGGAGDR